MVIFTLPRKTHRLFSKLPEASLRGLPLVRGHRHGALRDAHLAEEHVVGLQVELGGLRVQSDRSAALASRRACARGRERQAERREQREQREGL